MTENLTFPIVGMHFRPPAPAIVRHMAVNTDLTLVPEPHNEHDPNAIAVFVLKIDLIEQSTQNPKMLEAIRKQHFELMDLDETIQLGYIPAIDAARLMFDRKRTIAGKFLIRDNKPAVRMTGWKEDQS